MTKGRVTMGYYFFPRGGAAYVARYLTPALVDAGWSVSLASGSLGASGDETDAATFFAGLDVHPLDFTDAVRAFEAGGDQFATAVPMHASFEDRGDVPDAVFASVDPARIGHLAAVWEAPFVAAGADRATLFHLHHLTPQSELVRDRWPDVPRVVHLHGTDRKLVEGVDARVAIAAALGATLATMPQDATRLVDASDALDDDQRIVARTTRWDRWRHGEHWAARLREWAQTADQLVAVSPSDRDLALDVLGLDPERVSTIPNGVDLARFHPRPREPTARRDAFRRWLVEDPQGWTETGPPGSVAYREADLDCLLGPDGDAILLLFVGRFIGFKRVPLLIRAFALARERFDRPVSLVIWGGHPGEWEGEHPVTVAEAVGDSGIFFVGWRGHDELPVGLAASDVMVVPSFNDSYPQTVLEAMAVGLPVIGADSGGLSVMIDATSSRPTGWLVRVDDVDALADGLVAAVNQAGERSRRGEHALEHARSELSWHARVADFEEVYAAARAHRRRV